MTGVPHRKILLLEKRIHRGVVSHEQCHLLNIGTMMSIMKPRRWSAGSWIDARLSTEKLPSANVSNSLVYFSFSRCPSLLTVYRCRSLHKQETQGGPVYKSGGRPSITAVSSDDSTTIATSRDVEATRRESDSNISPLCHKGVGAPNNMNVSAFSSASVPSTLVAEATIDPRVQGTQAQQRGQETLRVTRLSRLLPFRRFEFTGEGRSTEAGRNEARRKDHRGSSCQAISGVESLEGETHGAPIAGELSGIATGSYHESGWRYRQPMEGARRNDRLSSLPPHPGRDKPEQRAGIQAGILRKMRSFPKRRRARMNQSL